MNRSLKSFAVLMVAAVGGSAYWAMAQTAPTETTPAAPAVAPVPPAPAVASFATVPDAPASPDAAPATLSVQTSGGEPPAPAVVAATGLPGWEGSADADVLIEAPVPQGITITGPKVNPKFIVKQVRARISMDAATDKLLAEYAKEGSDKEKIVGELRKIVEQQFSERQAERTRELTELEAQIQKLRTIHQQRESERERIVGDRVQQLLREAEGLGWGNNEPKQDLFATNPFAWSPKVNFERRFDLDLQGGPPRKAMVVEEARAKAQERVAESIEIQRAKADEARQRAQDQLAQQAKELEEQRAQLEKTIQRLKEQAPQGENIPK